MDREGEIMRVTILGGIANALLLVFKFLAGILGHSSAMIADAVHSLSDFLTDIIVIIFVHISGKPQDDSHDYGHGKYETLATSVIGLALVVVAAGIFYNGATKILDWARGGELTAPGMLAFWAAIASIAVKEAVYRYTVAVGKRLDSKAVVANAWHHRSDAFSSVATALGIGCAIFLGRRWAVLDPVASIVLGAFVLKMGWDLVRDGVGELLEESLPEEVENRILAIVTEFPDVTEPHHLRTRRIGNRYAIEMHLRMNGDISLREAHSKASQIEKRLKDEFGPQTHIGLHLEPEKSNGGED